MRLVGKNCVVLLRGCVGLIATADPALRYDGFTALYDEHVGEVFRFVHRRCRDSATAEDITQDPFLTAVRTIDHPDDISIGWLLSVARNRLVDVLRRQRRYAGKLRLVSNGPQLADDGLDIVERIRMDEALGRLSVDHRLVLILHYVDGLTVAALADELGRSAKAVESLITRARRNLRRELESTDA